MGPLIVQKCLTQGLPNVLTIKSGYCLRSIFSGEHDDRITGKSILVNNPTTLFLIFLTILYHPKILGSNPRGAVPKGDAVREKPVRLF